MPDPDRQILFSEAVGEAIELCLSRDKRVYVMGLGVPDPKGIFGTTLGLQKRFGKDRVMDMPTSENAMTGVALGSAILGMRPILTHQRLDFALLSLEQIVNQAAKWRYMFGGKMKVPLVIRMLVGRGWGQGPQHAQALHAWFAHIPGLKVVAPATPHDAKGLLISAVQDENPVIYIEHRWLHGISGLVPRNFYPVPIGPVQILKGGGDITIVSTSYMTIEALRAAAQLEKLGVKAEVVDLRTLRPLDDTLILQSVRKTGRLIVADIGWPHFGLSSEVIARVAEKALNSLKIAPQRLTLPDGPTPTSPALAGVHYPRASHLVGLAYSMVKGKSLNGKVMDGTDKMPLDVPSLNFTGPF